MLYNRQKLLALAIEFLNEKSVFSKTYLVKALFLLRQKFDLKTVGYDFFPYKFWPFSNSIYQDLKVLESDGLIENAGSDNALSITQKGKDLKKQFEINENIFSELNKIVLSFSNAPSITRFVYKNYPSFTVKSTKLEKKNSLSKGICSIGYEGKTLDCFLNELIQNDVSLVVDVRRNAFSMKNGFSKNRLKYF